MIEDFFRGLCIIMYNCSRFPIYQKAFFKLKTMLL